MWEQVEISLTPKARGFHLVTDEVVRQLSGLMAIEVGLAHFFLKHTSASLSLNENADPTVRSDMEQYYNRVAPEDEPYYRHTLEGSDDMPAHLKASLIGNELTIPVRDGRLSLGTWQGIYLGEHRDHGGGRRVTVTLYGKSYDRD